MKLCSKIFFFIALTLLTLFSANSPALAVPTTEIDENGQELTTPTITPIITEESEGVKFLVKKQTAIEKGSNQEAWIYEAIGSQIAAISMSIVGKMETNPDTTGTTTWVPGGIMGMGLKSITYLSKPPASGVTYIASSVNSFLGKQVLAANGTGFTQLQGLIPLWEMSRNIIYIFMSLVLVIIGLMIMFRVKISPQATITLQNSIPKVITTLILVTFSYAIAGLLVDLYYFVFAMGFKLLQSSIPGTPGFQDFLDSGTTAFGNATEAWLPWASLEIFGGILSALTSVLMMLNTSGTAQRILAGVAGVALGESACHLIVQIFVVVILIKFIVALAKCYITILLKVMFAPFEIGAGAIPSAGKTGFGSWFKGLAGNLAVFPGVSLFLIIANFILKQVGDNNIWIPEIIGNGGSMASFIIGGGNANFGKVAIGIGFLLILPGLPKLITESLFGIESKATEKAFAGGIAAVGSVGKPFSRMAKGFMGDQAKSAGYSILRNKAEGHESWVGKWLNKDGRLQNTRAIKALNSFNRNTLRSVAVGSLENAESRGKYRYQTGAPFSEVRESIRNNRSLTQQRTATGRAAAAARAARRAAAAQANQGQQGTGQQGTGQQGTGQHHPINPGQTTT